MTSLLDADNEEPLSHHHEPDVTSMALASSSFTVASSSSQQSNNTDNAINKWVKNGFGMPVTNNTGKFTPDESEMTRRAIEEYCGAKGISATRLCSECDHKADLKGAWMEIAQRLPHRSVQSVYRHGIRQLHPFKRGVWSEQECVMLTDLVQRMGKKWSAIQAKLNRSADSCRDKYREMSDEFVKGRWKEQEVEQLKVIIREFLNVPPDSDMRDLGRMVERQGIQIPWSSISKRMGKRSRLSCFKKWQKMSASHGANPSDNDADHHEPSPKRAKTDHQLDMEAASVLVGAGNNNDQYDIYSAKIAAETVEAVGLPNVRERLLDVDDV